MCLMCCCGFVVVSSWCPARFCTDVVRFSLKQETPRFILLSLVLHLTSSNIYQNGDGLRGLVKGMIDVQSQQGVLLAIISLTCLGCVYGLCLCCRKKSSMRQEDNDLYDQDDFNQDGKFTDCRKPTTVLRPSQRAMPSTSRLSTMNRLVNSDIHWSYQNLPDVKNGIMEPTYVDPIPNSIYANDDDTEGDPGTYENIFPTKKVQHDSDSCNYVNWDIANEDDEPDYVNDMTQ